MKLFWIILIFACCNAQAQLDDKTIRDLKSGRVENDTSYIYSLPFEKGKKHLLVQHITVRFRTKQK